MSSRAFNIADHMKNLQGTRTLASGAKIVGADADSIQAPGLITRAGGGDNTSLNTGLASATFPAGHVIQVVSENFEGTATATGTSEVNTFLTKSITSSKANSKFLVMVNSATGGDDATPIVILRRTIGSSSHDIVNDDSQGGITMRSDARLSNVRHLINFHLSYVDSPSSAASTTINYKIVLKGHNTGQNTFLGKSGYNAGDIKVLSSITIMELAA